jgi:hypothetical protein
MTPFVPEAVATGVSEPGGDWHPSKRVISTSHENFLKSFFISASFQYHCISLGRIEQMAKWCSSFVACDIIIKSFDVRS